MKGCFYIVGVGPGDPELVTVKAVRILEQCPVLFVPKGRPDGRSTALSILKGIVSTAGKEIMELHFPMKKIRMGKEIHPEVTAAWQAAARAVLAKIELGLDVAFPTLGDPAVYSTGFYLWETLAALAPECRVTFVPGVSAMGASAAAAAVPLCQGDDRMAVIPAAFGDERLQEALLRFDTVVLMKVHRVMDRIVPLLAELNLLEHAVLIEKTSQQGERIWRDLRQAAGQELHYFSTIIVRKQGLGARGQGPGVRG